MHGSLKGCKPKGDPTTPPLELTEGTHPLPLRMKTSLRTRRPGRQQRISHHSASKCAHFPIDNGNRKSNRSFPSFTPNRKLNRKKKLDGRLTLSKNKKKSNREKKSQPNKTSHSSNFSGAISVEKLQSTPPAPAKIDFNSKRHALPLSFLRLLRTSALRPSPTPPPRRSSASLLVQLHNQLPSLVLLLLSVLCRVEP